MRNDVLLAEVPFWPGWACCCWQVDCIFSRSAQRCGYACMPPWLHPRPRTSWRDVKIANKSQTDPRPPRRPPIPVLRARWDQGFLRTSAFACARVYNATIARIWLNREEKNSQGRTHSRNRSLFFRVSATTRSEAITRPLAQLIGCRSFREFIPRRNRDWSCRGSDMNRAGRRFCRSLSFTVVHRVRRLGRVSVSTVRFRAIQPPQRDHRQPLPLVSVPRRLGISVEGWTLESKYIQWPGIRIGRRRDARRRPGWLREGPGGGTRPHVSMDTRSDTREPNGVRPAPRRRWWCRRRGRRGRKRRRRNGRWILLYSRFLSILSRSCT